MNVYRVQEQVEDFYHRHMHRVRTLHAISLHRHVHSQPRTIRGQGQISLFRTQAEEVMTQEEVILLTLLIQYTGLQQAGNRRNVIMRTRHLQQCLAEVCLKATWKARLKRQAEGFRNSLEGQLVKSQQRQPYLQVVWALVQLPREQGLDTLQQVDCQRLQRITSQYVAHQRQTVQLDIHERQDL